MLRSTKHSLKFSNIHKKVHLIEFIQEYRRVALLIIQDIWKNGYEDFLIQNKNYKLPKYINYKHFNIGETKLSARALSSLTNQLSGVIRACTDKQKRRLFQYNITPNIYLKRAIDNFKTSCPSVDKLNPELSSKCVDFQDSQNNKSFIGFIKLKSLGATFPSLHIPIKGHKNSRKFIDQGFKRKNSFLIREDAIDLRWEKDISLKTSGITLGADQGQTTVLSLSDGQITKPNIHGKTLKTICNEMAQKKKGSKAFHRIQEERKNYIHWSINQLNFDHVKQINLEEVKNLRFKRNTSASLKHFTYTIIENKLLSRAEELGVHVQMQSSAFRSQRCSECGWVQKKNRKAKQFLCNNCSFNSDSDINAAINHTFELTSLLSFVKSGINQKGFFWMPDGLFDRFGQEFRVPDPFKNK